MERLFKRGDVWYVHVYENGRRIQRTTRCRDKKAAEAIARGFERAAADPAHAAAQAVSLREVLQLVINLKHEEAIAGRRSHATVDFYLRTAGHLVRVFGEDFKLAGIDAPRVDSYISQRRGEKASDHTINKELVPLRLALKLALRQKLWKGDPAEVLPIGISAGYKPRQRFLTREELAKLFAELTPDRAARIAFLVAVAATWSDTDRAQDEDFARNLSMVWVRGEKTDYRARLVPIVANWQRSLLEYALRHCQGDGAYLFRRWSNVRREIHAACDRAGIDHCSPNDLRRTCATWLRRDGAAPDLVASVLGHADSRMVERVYGRLTYEILQARLENELSSACIAGASNRVDPAVFRALPALSTEAASKEFPILMVPRGGIEPPTRGFSVLCSTD